MTNETKIPIINQNKLNLTYRAKETDNFVINDNYTQLLSNVMKIYLLKSKYEFNNEDIYFLLKFFETCDYFKKFGDILTKSFVSTISKGFQLKKYNSNEEIYLHDDKCDGFYLILKGKVSLSVPVKIKENTKSSQKDLLKFRKNIIKVVNQGQGFGEYSIFYKCLRETTATSDEDTTLLFMPSEFYIRHLSILESNLITNTTNILRKFPFFNDFSFLELEKLHFIINKIQHFKGQRIYKSRTRVDGFYLVLSGVFELSKEICVNSPIETEGDSFETKIDLSILKPNDIFGDTEVLFKQKFREYSVLCIEAGETLFIQKDFFFSVLSKFTLHKKYESNITKMDQLNNIYKMKILGKGKGLENLRFLQDYKHSYNYHGFAEIARKNYHQFQQSIETISNIDNKCYTNDYLIRAQDSSNKIELIHKYFSFNKLKPEIKVRTNKDDEFEDDDDENSTNLNENFEFQRRISALKSIDITPKSLSPEPNFKRINMSPFTMTQIEIPKNRYSPTTTTKIEIYERDRTERKSLIMLKK